MNIPNIPYSHIATKDGQLTPEWRDTFQQLTNQMQTFLSDEAYVLPTQPSPRAATPSNPTPSVLGLNTQSKMGGMYYSSSNNAPNTNIQQYGDDGPSNTFSFIPVTTYNQFSTLSALNSVPTSQINGKIAMVMDGSHDDTLYVGVNNQWRGVALT